MRFRQLFLLLLAAPCLGAEVKSDLLRFGNGDQLHGRFTGMGAGPSVMWKRDDIGDEVKFDAADLRQIVLRGGRPAKALTSLSHIGTINGDRIPGIIRKIDAKQVTIETEFSGMLEFPREKVGLLAPNPLGGRVLYQGPFDASEWLNISAEHPEGLSKKRVNSKPKADFPQWEFSGSAWYWQNKNIGSALVRKSGMPDRAILQFDLAWKNRLSLAIAFHSDFTRPVGKKAEEQQNQANLAGQPASLPSLFGNSYVIQLYANYVRLFRTSFDKEGVSRMDPVQTANGNMRLGESGNARIELRANRLTGEIVLFIDGEFVIQWSELDLGGNEPGADAYAGKGDGFGFVVQAENSPARISEVVVAEWNGMPDAARSLQIDDADIVLLNNGTDRFAGKVTELNDGKLKLESRYGDFEFPVEDIAEVRFAKSRLAEKQEDASASLKVRLYPMGCISGQPLGGDEKNLRMINAAAGQINMSLDSAVMLELHSTDSFLDDWDMDF